MINEKTTNKALLLFKELDELFKKLPNQSSNWYKAGIALSEIEKCEAQLKICLSDEHKAALQLFDGFDEAGLDLYLSDGRAGFGGFNSINTWRNAEAVQLQQELAAEFNDRQIKTVGSVKAVMYHPKWIEIAHGGDISWCIDFAPENEGDAGQIIMIWFDYDQPMVSVVAQNFFIFMEIMIQSLKDEIAQKYPVDWGCR